MSGGIFIPTTGTLELPGQLSLSGTSVDFGAIAAGSLNLGGTGIFADNATFGGDISIASQGLLDFAGTLIAGGNAQTPDQPEVSLAAGAVLTGSGRLVAADSGILTGAGTVLAAGGDTLLLAAGSIGGGAQVQVDGGGVLGLEPQLTLDSSVTLAFGSDYGVAPIIGGFADSLAQDGGVIVINDPQIFDGTITGFAPGDRLVFPGLTGLSLSNITSQSFVVTGRNSASQVEQVTLHAPIPAGTTLALGVDGQGDAQVGLQNAAELFIGGSSFSAGQIEASAGVGQKLLGLQMLPPGWTTQSLTLTLAVNAGDLSYGTVTPATQLVLTAASPTALNNLLSQITYTAGLSATADALVATGNTGLLAGLSSSVPITIEPGGTVIGFATPPTAEQTAIFSGSTASMILVTQSAAPGELSVSGAADFADVLAASGIGGTALIVDVGGSAIFDASAHVTLGGDATIGDAGGAGTLGIVTSDFVANANLVLGGNSAASGSAAEITGALSVAGGLLVGQAATSRLDVSGILSANATTIGAAGTFTANGGASIAFGGLLDSGTLLLENAAQATAQALVLAGQLTLGGDATLSGLSSAIIATGGALTLGQGAALSAFGLNALGGSVLDQGVLLLGGNLLADTGVTLAGGGLQASAATIAGAGIVSGFGTLEADGAGAKILLDGGEILASGGLLTLNGNVTLRNGGSIIIAGSAALDLLQGAAGGEINFAGAGAVLTVNDFVADSSAVAGMLAGDVIDLIGVAPSLVTYAGGTISAAGSNSFALGIAASQPPLTILPDGDGGALLTLGGEMACFAGGTRLLTPNGYVAVEAFKPGDPIITRLGIRRAVRWIGRRNVELGARARQELRPVLVLPSAMGPGIPSRAVRLSPSHAVFIEDVLVPVMHLVNGATILRERRAAVTYYHIELDRHDVLMAEGLPVESYLDTGNRGQFQQEQGVRGSATRPCAQLVTGGAKLARIRRRLHEFLLRAGFSVAAEPELRAIAGEATLTPQLRRNRALLTARFDLPPHSGRLLLHARGAAPAETDPDSDDRRELALCLRQPRAKRQRLALGAGWYRQAPGDTGIWMSSSGEILLPPNTCELTLNLVAIAQHWRRPVDLAPAGL